MKKDIRWAAEQCLEHGKKVRICSWPPDHYVYLYGGIGIVVNEKINPCFELTRDFLCASSSNIKNVYWHEVQGMLSEDINSEWELFEDTREMRLISTLKSLFYELEKYSCVDIDKSSHIMNRIRTILINL